MHGSNRRTRVIDTVDAGAAAGQLRLPVSPSHSSVKSKLQSEVQDPTGGKACKRQKKSKSFSLSGCSGSTCPPRPQMNLAKCALGNQRTVARSTGKTLRIVAGYEPQLLLMISLHSVPWARATSLAQCGPEAGTCRTVSCRLRHPAAAAGTEAEA